MSRDPMAGVNIRAAVREVNYYDLEQVKEGSCSRSCPACKRGNLVVRRDNKDFSLISEHDICLLCGQRFRYQDIDKLRKALHDPRTLDQVQA